MSAIHNFIWSRFMSESSSIRYIPAPFVVIPEGDDFVIYSGYMPREEVTRIAAADLAAFFRERHEHILQQHRNRKAAEEVRRKPVIDIDLGDLELDL